MSSQHTHVTVRGAREHNLRNVDLDFPRDSLVTFTGVSGSGKSSLAHHTIYQEGQRRFLESLSSYARQFLGRMEKPKVDVVDGLSPTVSIDQKSVGHSPRSTVGTLTEIADFLRLLYARIGDPRCPVCDAAIESWSIERILEAILDDLGDRRILVLAPVVKERKGEYRKELEEWRARGFVRARIDGEVRRLDEDIALERYKYHTIELVCDRLRLKPEEKSRLAEAVEQAVQLGDGTITVHDQDNDEDSVFSTSRACPNGHGALPEIEPRLFSFNSPVGGCPTCDGLGLVHTFDPDLLVADPESTVRDGALFGFNNAGRLMYGRLGLDHLEEVAESFEFDLDTPWRELTKKQQQVVLYGSGQKRFQFRWQKSGRNSRSQGKVMGAWPGVVPHLENVYRGSTARHLDRFRRARDCDECGGARLNEVARSVRFEGRSLPETLAQPIGVLREAFARLKLGGSRGIVAREILPEIEFRLRFLSEVGLDYLTLDRRANTLSGGESQRIRLAAQVGAGLRGVLYVLDEPSIGLHARDQERLIGTLQALRDRGNSVLVVEHDEQTMRSSDWLVDVGPGAGVEGGEIVSSGPPEEVAKSDSLTARFLRGEEVVPIPASRRGSESALWVRGAAHHNLKNLDVRIPLGVFVAVTGVSGSGKSTLVNHILKKALRRHFHKAHDVPGQHKRIDGLDHLDKIIEIDQSPIGRTPRSNPATYTKLWDQVRNLFAELPESRVRGYTKSRFSFNVEGGRCAVCEGAGVKTLEMQFLAPVEIVCEECDGSRFDPDTLDIKFKDYSVADLLKCSIDEALQLFTDLPKIRRPLEMLQQVGLGYLQLGQPSTTLSGGEAQRVKLASELQRPATGRTLYVLDEPTTGLHFDDIRKLLECLQALVDSGNSVLVIEHDLDVVQCADWCIDLGPGGGPNGGTIVAEGTPEELAKVKGSETGRALGRLLRAKSKHTTSKPVRGRRLPTPTHLEVQGARQNNLKSVDVQIPLDAFTVITGPSGSGKTSLAFDTLFSEGQRRFVESLSTYARRFLGRLDRAPVDKLEGIGPAIAIDQKAASRSPRSTVATSTEIQDYLRLLYARVGRSHCPTHGQELELLSPTRIANRVSKELEGERGYLCAPWREPVSDTREELEEAQARWREQGFVRALVDGEEQRLEEPFPDDCNDVQLVIDRLKFDDKKRITEGIAAAADESGGFVVFRTAPRSGDPKELRYSTDGSCPDCGHSTPADPHPRWFSFNHHSGACETCAGLGRIAQCVPELLVNHPDKPVFKGGVKHKGAAFTFLTKPTGYWAKLGEEVAKHYGFSLATPWNDLDEGARQVLLYGAGDARFPVKFTKRRATGSRTMAMDVRWRGLCGQIERWFHGHEASSSVDTLRPVMREDVCPECQGQRLGRAQRHVFVGGRSLPEFSTLRVDEALQTVTSFKLTKREREIADDVLREVSNRLRFLAEVGLGYLSLNRSAATLSGGEAQRIRLATQLGNRLVGVLYVLDEPTIGLHPRDTERLLGTLRELRDLGNTVVAVEHDEDVIRQADHVVDMGPGAGHHGGQVVASGTPEHVSETDGPTGRFLRGDLEIPIPPARRTPRGHLRLTGASTHNLQNLDVEFPLGVLCAITGVSGSGKSTLVLDTLIPRLTEGEVEVGSIDDEELPEGFEYSAIGKDIPSVVVVDQSPIGTTPSSNPATYTGVFTEIRTLFSKLPQSRVKGFEPGRFSFNVAAGRCDECEGKGQIRVEMHFLADVWVTCERCRGRRFNEETLAVELHGRSIADVLDMEVEQALGFFRDHPRIRKTLQLLCDVGLGYLRLGQSATTLSGGEAQRLKLVGQLQKKPRGHTVYVLDEPTTGLHMEDVRKLCEVLQRLVDRGDSVLVVEHHLDVIKIADWVLELGPEAGPDGGQLIFEGSPEEMVTSKASQTGSFLGARLGASGGKTKSKVTRRSISKKAGTKKTGSKTAGSKKTGTRKKSTAKRSRAAQGGG
ncbi:MAG: excinuclease ABC subunit UvrA [Planctomycetota bacterium]